MTVRASGFTMIELVLVMVVVAILSSTAIFSLSGMLGASKDRSDLDAVRAWLVQLQTQAIYFNHPIRVQQTERQVMVAWWADQQIQTLAVRLLDEPVEPLFPVESNANSDLQWVLLPTGQRFELATDR